MAHELTRLRPRGRETQAINHVVETRLERLQQHHARDPAMTRGGLEIAAELVLQHAVDALDLLLLAQLEAIADCIFALRGLPCCPGGRLRFSIAHFSV